MSTNKAFLGINLDLINNPKYQKLDTRALILYSLYADRSEASLHNAQNGDMSFCDASGVFVYYSNELAAKIIRVSEKTVSKFRKQLVDLGLISIKRNGLKGYKIYVNAVQETPNNIDLVMPWKNHSVQVQKQVNEWTMVAKLEFVKSLGINVKENSSTTCRKNVPTSLSQASLSKNINNNALLDNARVRKNAKSKDSNNYTENPYHSLPEKIKTSFADVFGFITKPIAIELQALINESNVDMVNYAITKSKGHRITNCIAYLKATITSALKQGAKTVQDMIDQTRNFKNQHHYSKHKRFAKHGTFDEKAALAKLSKTNPKKYQQLLDQRRQQQELASREIPIFKLSDVFA